LHGDIRVDDYAWLRQKEDPEVIRHLEAENAFTDSLMKPTEELQEIIYKEMVGRIKETDMDVPYPYGGYLYYTRTEEGKQYSINCRKKDAPGAPEEVILDRNDLAKGLTYMSVGTFTVSPDQNLLAFSIDTSGYEAYDLLVKDLRTGGMLADRIPDVVSVVWANDGKTLFYSKRDAARRPYRLFRHELGADPLSDPMILEEKDELYNLFVSRTKSDAYIMAGSASSTTSEFLYLSADRPREELKVLHARETDHELSVDHHGDFFYIMSNKGAKNFRLVKAPVGDPSPENWTEVLPHRPDVTLESMEMFRDYIVVAERKNGLQELRVMDLASGGFHSIEFPEPVYSAFFGTNEVFDSKVLRFSYQSFVTPPSVYDYAMDTKGRTLMKQTEVLGGYDPALYASERIIAKAPDGASVPISIVYKKGVVKDGRSPLHLYGYGSYGAAIPVSFSSSRLSLLDRGFVYALAHIRGGGDMGRDWKDDGRMLKKKNTFTDFIACAEHLIAEKYTSAEKLTIEGGSAGGLLIGAVVNMRPDLFKAALALVPFVDVMNTMLDPSLPLTVGEYLEWGNPNEKASYDYMKSYCPYTNVAKQNYPNILVRVGLNDPRVGYWEGTKWAARLRDMKTGANRVLMKINMGAGHGGASGRYSRLRETAFNYAYILSQHGLTSLETKPPGDWKK
ncbi:MAG TPA: S9 family peptidase, partial [Bacteroidota bacterium]|nr:S9 family peptidase [Bacteroidota bacterium]